VAEGSVDGSAPAGGGNGVVRGTSVSCSAGPANCLGREPDSPLLKDDGYSGLRDDEVVDLYVDLDELACGPDYQGC
jgi:hypothetical protein